MSLYHRSTQFNNEDKVDISNPFNWYWIAKRPVYHRHYNLNGCLLEEDLTKLNSQVLKTLTPLQWDFLSQHPKLTMPIVKRIEENLLFNDHFNWKWLSRNDDIVTLNNLTEYRWSPWDWYWVSRNECITVEFIRLHMDYPWNAKGLLRNGYLSFKDLSGFCTSFDQDGYWISKEKLMPWVKYLYKLLQDNDLFVGSESESENENEI